MAKIEKKSKTKLTKKTTTSVALKSCTTIQKAKSVGRVTSNVVAGKKTNRKSNVSTNQSKSQKKTTTPTVAAVNKAKKILSLTKLSPAKVPQPGKRTTVQPNSKSQPPTRQPVTPRGRSEPARRENPLDQKQISTEELRAMLLERRNGLLKNIDEEIAPIQENSTPVIVGDVADLAQESSKNDIVLHVAEVESRELEQIDKAIRKIGEGTYGVCEKCGGNISPARLKAIPFANKCIRCQEEDERETF